MIPKDCKRLADLPAAPCGVAAQAGVDSRRNEHR